MQRRRDGGTDSPGRTGDQDDLARMIFHAGTSSFVIASVGAK